MSRSRPHGTSWDVWCGAVDNLYKDPQALATAIRDARGTMSQKALADWLGISKKTVGRWEAADEASLGETPERRRATAILVAEATGRRDLLGLNEPESDPRWQQVEDSLNFLLEALRRLTMQALEGDELDEFQQWWTSDPRSGGLDL